MVAKPRLVCNDYEIFILIFSQMGKTKSVVKLWFYRTSVKIKTKPANATLSFYSQKFFIEKLRYNEALQTIGRVSNNITDLESEMKTLRNLIRYRYWFHGHLALSLEDQQWQQSLNEFSLLRMSTTSYRRHSHRLTVAVWYYEIEAEHILDWIQYEKK